MTFTVLGPAMIAGAVYSPFEMVPTAGLRLQATAVLAALLTCALNRSVCFALRDTNEGTTVTDTEGTSVIVALADLVGYATLVALTTTVWFAEMIAGAV